MIFFTREQMRALDRAAIDEVGIPGVVLMENAGRGAAAIVESFGPRRVAIVCGAGNNGGDGFVLARHLGIAGIARDVLLVSDRARVGGDARVHMEAYERGGGEIIDASRGLAAHRERLDRADLMVDALFGTGLDRPLTGLFADAIDILSSLSCRKVALDLPSGLCANDGHVLGRALAVDVTITFAGYKRGLLLHPGATLAGTVHVVSIGVPPAVADRVGYDGELLDDDVVRPDLPPRAPTAHKGTAGHLLVVAGSPGRTGAALLCANAAMRAGAGLVTIATRPGAREALDQKVVEVMTATLGDGELGELVRGKSALAVGPGLGVDDVGRCALKSCLDADRPMVLDADALTLLAEDKGLVSGRRRPVVLTPHPGEMARLTGASVEAVQADRVGVARAFARDNGVIVVLKGARTVIAEPSGRLTIAPFDNPGLGSGGTGDVLTGVIGALLAGGLGEARAARAGVYLHGLAGEGARQLKGERGLIARDVIASLPAALARFE